MSGVVHFSRRIPAGKQEQQNAADAEEEEHSKQQLKSKNTYDEVSQLTASQQLGSPLLPPPVTRGPGLLLL